MALDHNPTKTLSIEKAWLREIDRRWKQFGKDTTRKLAQINARTLNNVAGIPPGISANDVFFLTPEEVKEYLEFFELEINNTLLGTDSAPNWQARYQLESYLRGVERSDAGLKSQAAQVEDSGADTVRSFLDGAGAGISVSATLAFAVQAFRRQHINQVEFFFDRSYETLNGWTDALKKETKQIVRDSINQQRTIGETAALINDRVRVSGSRAKTIARTEVNDDYNEAVFTEADRINAITGDDGILIRWQSAFLPTTRHLHGTWSGDLINTREARRRKSPPHIYNCKCSSKAVVASLQTPEMQAKFDKEKREFQKSETRLNL